MPRVSVIIPTYDWSEVLPYSIGSVLRQTMDDLEVLVVGDGCTDDSEQVVEAIGDPRVRWYNADRNHRDQAVVNQWALEHARSPVVSYLNHDDLYLPHALEAMSATIDAGATCCHGIVYMVVLDSRPLLGSTTADGFDPGHWMSPSGVMHTLDAGLEVGGWKRRIETGEVPQEEFWNRLLRAGHEFEPVPRVVSVKFPAAWRPNLYTDRPSHEQEAWTKRILAEPDLERTLMADLLRHYSRDAVITPGRAFQALQARARGLLTRPLKGRKRRKEIEHWKRVQEYKGLDPRAPGDDAST